MAVENHDDQASVPSSSISYDSLLLMVCICIIIGERIMITRRAWGGSFLVGTKHWKECLLHRCVVRSALTLVAIVNVTGMTERGTTPHHSNQVIEFRESM